MTEKIIFIALGCLGLYLTPALAQSGEDFAGEDKITCPGKEVVIGGSVGGSYCYKWTASDGSFTSEEANPTVSPTMTTSYTVEVSTEDLSQFFTGSMTVDVKGIESISAMPTKCCWKKGDPILADQFTIETVPPDLNGGIIMVTPATAPNVLFATGTTEVTVSFQCAENDPKVETQTEITVVDTASSINVTYEKFETEVIDRDVNKLENIFKKFGADCDLELIFSGGFTLELGKTCCEDPDCISVRGALSGSAEGSFGVQCDFPFYGIPHIAEVELVVGVGGTLDVSIEDSYECGEMEVCGSATLGVNVSGGAGIEALGGALVEGEILVKGGVTASGLKYCYPKNQFEWFSQACFNVKVCGEVTLGSFWKAGFEKVIYETCIP